MLQGTNDKMPAIGLGTWLSESGEVYEATKIAIDAGYRHIDEAWIYGNEEEVGKALAEKMADGTVKREELWITSKLWNSFHRPELVRKHLQESLTRLRLDYLDLYLVHFPVSFVPGVTEATQPEEIDQTPLADTWAEMEKAVHDKLVRNIGVSNHEIEHIKAIQACHRAHCCELIRDAALLPAQRTRQLLPRTRNRGHCTYQSWLPRQHHV